MDAVGPTRSVQDSKVTLAQHMGVAESNVAGAVHGGVIMKMVDTAGALAAAKFCGHPVVTAAIDEMSFLEPVKLGDVVTATASVNGVGQTSMEVGVKVETENVLTGQRTHTATAYLLYVAMDAKTNRPTAVPELVTESAQERRRQRQAKARRKARIARREAALASRAAQREAERRKQEKAEARKRARMAKTGSTAAQATPPASPEPPISEQTPHLGKWRSSRSSATERSGLAPDEAGGVATMQRPDAGSGGGADPNTLRWRSGR